MKKYIKVIIFVILAIFISGCSKDNNKEKLEQADAKLFSVKFDIDGKIFEIFLENGKKIEEPKNPVKEGYTFDAWNYKDETFDFNTEIKEDVLLVAKWKELEKEPEKDKNDEKETNVVTPKPDTPKKPTSNETTMNGNVFNLKDNIMVKQVHSETLCGFAMFIDNFKDVFPTVNTNYNTVSYYSFDPEYDKDKYAESFITDVALNENFSKLKFNTTKEDKAKSTLEDIKKGNYTGISDFKYSYDTHKFTYSFDYLQFQKSSTFSTKTDGLNVYKKMEEAFGGSLKFIGPCGGASPEYQVLTKELCSKYNLKCQ